MNAPCCLCDLPATEHTVTLYTDRGEESFCHGCLADFVWRDRPTEGFDHAGLEGYDPAVVELADRLLAMSNELLAEVAARKEWSVTREDWVAVQQLENAGNSVYSAQCWVLRAEAARSSRRGVASAGGEVLE